jgi:ribose/xylose/arabinose/galactoside ABC-type transport system permease subunit
MASGRVRNGEVTALVTGDPPQSRRSTAARLDVQRLLTSYGALVVLIALLVVAAIVEPRFFTEDVIRNTGRMAGILGVVVVGQVLVLLVRCVDLSVAAVIGFTVVLVAEGGPGLRSGIVIAVAIAVAVGLVNGWLVTKRAVPPFIATFGMFVLLDGARFAYTEGSTSGRVDAALVDFARHPLGPVSVPVVVWIAVTAAASIFVAKTVTGRRMVMAGSNERMARLSGLPVARYQTVAFVVCSLLAVVSGLLLAGSTSYVDRFVGRNSELDSITAALLGGAQFSGGEGSFVGGAIGSLLLASLFSLIVLLGWPAELQLVARGCVLVLALAMQGLLRRGRAG